jgi:Flp pilus assembly protein TadG
VPERIVKSRPAPDERGAVLVEAAVVFPVIFLIVVAVLEYGLLFAGQSTTETATRDGARYGSANFGVAGDKAAAADQVAAAVAKDLGARTGFDTPLKLFVYKADVNGDPAGGYSGINECNLDCYRYTWNSATNAFDPVSASPGWSNPQACIIDSAQPPNPLSLDSIGVYLELRHDYITKMVGSVQTLKEHTVSRLEPLPLSQCT